MITQHKIIYNLRFVLVVAAVLLVGFVGQAYGQTAAPSAVVLKTPASSPGNNPTPTFTVTVGANGGVVTLHPNSDCSRIAARRSFAVNDPDPPHTVDVTASSLLDGSYTFYAKHTKGTGSNRASPCSTASASYTLDTTAPVISVQTTGSGASAQYTPSSDDAAATARYKDNTPAASCVATADTTTWTAYTTGTALSAHDANGLCIIYTDAVGNAAAKHIADAVPPPAPSSIVLSSPSSSPGSDTTPTFTVTVGAAEGTVTLYSNNTCSTAASSAVTVSDTTSPYTVDITADALSTEQGYTFYAKHTKGGLSSGCSSARASYTLRTTTSTTSTSSSSSSRRRSSGGGGGGGGGGVGTLTRDTAAAPVVGGTPIATCTGNPTIIALMPTYTRGTTNNIIQLFQQALNAQGHAVSQTGPGSPGRETSYFGPATERAVRAFQTAYNLPTTGTLDPATQCALIPDITDNSLTLANIIADLQRQVAELIAARGS